MSLHGTILGKYTIIERLGEGGMGTVYRAHDELVDRDVAIKVLRPELSRQSSLVDRFRAEANALARLAHPRIASLHGLERDGDQLYMVMEFVRGETLEALVHRVGRLPWRRAAELCAGVCDALDHAHDEGVVHRDIKPANIMLAPGGRLKVMDFGIARVAGRGRQTQVGHSVGTPMYMAPEQLRGEEVDGRADLYALGAVLYELITGQLAFDADSDYKLMMMQLNDPPPAPSAAVAGVPDSVDGIVARAMCKRADERYASAAAMKAALERAIREAPDGPADTDVAKPSPATRLAVPSTPAPSTSAPVAPTGNAPVTRVADGDGIGRTRIAGDEPAMTPIWLDWRVWALAAAAVIVMALLLRPSSPAPGPVLADLPVPPVTQPAQASRDPVPAPTPSRLTDPVGTSGGTVRPPVRTVPSDLHPISPDNESGAGGSSSRRRPSPPAEDPSPPGRVSPPKADPVNDHPPASPPAESGAAASARARSVISNWLGGLTDGNAGRISQALDGSGRAQADLLTLVRDNRVAGVTSEGLDVQVNDDRGTATASTTVTWRSAFGATRRVPVRFSFELRREGAEWRVAAAHIIGSPTLR